MLVFDCFNFFNELDVLEIRLNELSSVVDFFVLGEATVTFRGDPKPLHFHRNRDRFESFRSRIIHVVIEDTPLGGETEADHWQREYFQRNALARGLFLAGDSDLALQSDVDEIPRATAIRDALGTWGNSPTVHLFELRWYWWFLNLERPSRWLNNGPRMIRSRDLTTFQDLRNVSPPNGSAERSAIARQGPDQLLDRRVHKDAGWHFSYIGGIDMVMAKMNSYSHIISHEYSDRFHLERQIAAGRSYNPRDADEFTRRSIDETFPQYIVENRERFRNLIFEP